MTVQTVACISCIGKISTAHKSLTLQESAKQNIENLTVSRVGKVINAINRTVKIECKLPKNNGLIPNLMAELNINHYTKDSAICLPSRLILKNSKGVPYTRIHPIFYVSSSWDVS